MIAWANRPLLDDEGEVRHIVTSGLDVTESETTNAELWALQSELRDRLAHLSRLAAEQAALRRVATLVASEPAPEEVFEVVTREAGDLLGADSGLLLCYSDDHGTGRVVGRYSEADPDPLALGAVLPVDGDSLTRPVLETGQAVYYLVSEALTNATARPARHAHPGRAAAALRRGARRAS